MGSNTALGEVWRAISVFRKGDERVQELCDRLGAAVQGDPKMQAWLESTYNMQACLLHPLVICTVYADSNQQIGLASSFRFMRSAHSLWCDAQRSVQFICRDCGADCFANGRALLPTVACLLCNFSSQSLCCIVAITIDSNRCVRFHLHVWLYCPPGAQSPHPPYLTTTAYILARHAGGD
jgi:hypothetical protein